jgi:CDP-diacylglycerol--glycerol-3-phosphate 3-phosphatidyltransferase
MRTDPAAAPPAWARRLRRVPNALTVGRLLALPVLAWVLLTVEGPTSALAAWLFAGIAVTDFIDGRLARALQAESAFGAVADPLADRALVAVGLIGLITLGRMHPAGPLIVLGRDVIAVVAAIALRGRGVVLRIDMLGKTSSALVMVGVALALLAEALWIDMLFWAGVALSVVAFANYARSAVRQIRHPHVVAEHETPA